MTDRSIAQAAAYIQAQLANNPTFAQFSALNADERSVGLYGIYAVLAGAHGIGTPGTATAAETTTDLEDDENEGQHNVRVPTLKQARDALKQYLEVSEKEAWSVASSRAGSPQSGTPEVQTDTPGQDDLEWAILGLSALSVYAATLQALKTQTLPLSQDLLYWDSVLYGDRDVLNLALYSLQMLPGRAYAAVQKWASDAVSARPGDLFTAENVQASIQQTMQDAVAALKHLVHLVKRLRKRLAKSVSSPWSVLFSLYSPLNSARASAKDKRKHISKLRNTSAQTLGYLVGEGLNIGDGEWTRAVSVHVEQMQTALTSDIAAAHTLAPQSLSATGLKPAPEVAAQLLSIIEDALPARRATYAALTGQYGTPSRATRYWPAALGLGLAAQWTASSVVRNRQAIVAWVRTQVVDTAVAFYRNWIVAPLVKIYGTVRHDSNAQVALMTKQSLDADMRSLERMVVAFAEATNASSPDAVDAAALQAAVRQGDISSVLIPYERQIQTPFKSAVAGQLVQALLIQVQKTKVDVEVAVSGIDKLLKSQELVFGVVAALPSMLASAWGLRWLRAALSGESRHVRGRRELSQTAFQVLGRADRLLLLLGRTLTDETAGDAGAAAGSTHKYHQTLGLLLCEISLLRDLGAQLLPAAFQRQWALDLSDLEDFSGGARARVVERQRAVLGRIYNVYGRSL